MTASRRLTEPKQRFSLFAVIFTLILLFAVVHGAVTLQSDVIFADGFESGTFAIWDAVVGDGDIWVTGAAALNESYGMRIDLDDTVANYVEDTRPNFENSYRARFYFDPNSVAMANGESHIIFLAFRGGRRQIQVTLNRVSGTYQLQARTQNDAGSYLGTPLIIISDAPHYIETAWTAATSAGANDGSLYFYIDGVERGQASGLDNDTLRIDTVRLGAVESIDNRTTGSYFFDSFWSQRTGYIGAEVPPTLADTATPSPSPTSTPSPTFTPSMTFTATTTPTATFTPTNTPTLTSTPSSTPVTPAGGDVVVVDQYEPPTWNSVINPSFAYASGAAAIFGSAGMQVDTAPSRTSYAVYQLAQLERNLSVRFYFDPNSLTMRQGDMFTLLDGWRSSLPNRLPVRIQVNRVNNAYYVQARILTDAGAWTNSPLVPLPDSPQMIAFDWKASSASGANDGYYQYNFAGQQGMITGIDNDTYTVNMLRLGMSSATANMVSGSVYFDALRVQRGGLIGEELHTATPTDTFTSTITDTPSSTFTPSATSTLTNTPSATFTRTATSSRTPTPTRTLTSTPSQTWTASPTATPSATYTPQSPFQCSELSLVYVSMGYHGFTDWYIQFQLRGRYGKELSFRRFVIRWLPPMENSDAELVYIERVNPYNINNLWTDFDPAPLTDVGLPVSVTTDMPQPPSVDPEYPFRETAQLSWSDFQNFTFELNRMASPAYIDPSGFNGSVIYLDNPDSDIDCAVEFNFPLPTSTPTLTPTSTPTDTLTPSITPSISLTPTSTWTPSNTPTATATPTSTFTRTPSRTPSPIPGPPTLGGGAG